MIQDLRKRIEAQTEKIEKMVNKEFKELKEQINRDKQCNNWSEKYTRRNQQEMAEKGKLTITPLPVCVLMKFYYKITLLICLKIAYSCFVLYNRVE